MKVTLACVLLLLPLDASPGEPQKPTEEKFATESKFTQVARAGLVAVVPSDVRHSVKALTDGRAIIVDYPLRREFA